ncbi:hypothetical protein B0T19DRAFT_477691 [Cercophora scortea]|uniref:F-box domain-containing protein n=1 Tax=Cercophora scortea TaxID=314031 RepID=A0AAE0I988_9PEZI|nr:hypothetical protein B0T19DRAFT_477691 [Cercophora scortea]
MEMQADADEVDNQHEPIENGVADAPSCSAWPAGATGGTAEHEPDEAQQFFFDAITGTVTKPVPEDDLSWMHPLMAAAYHNRTRSWLGRLPTAVQMRILHLADPTTRECLRRTCRVFMQLHASPYALKLFEPEGYRFLRPDANPWPIVRPPYIAGPDNLLLYRLLRQVLYCRSCLAAWYTADWPVRYRKAIRELLYCSGCHPACLFSPAQRQTPSSATRFCIGHQGFVRLCEHKTVAWSQITDMVESITSKKRPARCRYRSIECRHESHRHVRCPWTPARQSSVHVKSGSYYPALTVDLRNPDDFVISLEWAAHVAFRVPGYGRGKHEERPVPAPLKAQVLEARLAMLRTSQAKYICPEYERGSIVEAQLFDPGRCGCLVYDGNVDKAYWRHLADEDIHYSTPALRLCAAQPRRRLTPLVRAAAQPGLGVPYCGRFKSMFRSQLESHTAKWDTARRWKFSWKRVPFSNQTQSVEARRCVRSKDCMKLVYKRQWSMGNHTTGWTMNAHWFEALDPDSYQLTQDMDGLGVYWCKESSCRNYYRYSRSRIRPILKWEEFCIA